MHTNSKKESKSIRPNNKHSQFNCSFESIGPRNRTASINSKVHATEKTHFAKTIGSKFQRLRKMVHTEAAKDNDGEFLEQQFQKEMENVQERGFSLYRFGFLSNEKKVRNQKIFG